MVGIIFANKCVVILTMLNYDIYICKLKVGLYLSDTTKPSAVKWVI